VGLIKKERGFVFWGEERKKLQILHQIKPGGAIPG